MFFVLVGFLFLYFAVVFGDKLGDEIKHIFLFPFIFILINYAFIRLLLGFIKFYNDLLVINDGELIVIKSSLLFKDNIEFIDINKITKLDTYCRGLIPNVLGFGILVAEQQRDEVREFHYVPEPFKALQIINEEKQQTIEDMKKRYVIPKKSIK